MKSLASDGPRDGLLEEFRPAGPFPPGHCWWLDSPSGVATTATRPAPCEPTINRSTPIETKTFAFGLAAHGMPINDRRLHFRGVPIPLGAASKKAAWNPAPDQSACPWRPAARGAGCRSGHSRRDRKLYGPPRTRQPTTPPASIFSIIARLFNRKSIGRHVRQHQQLIRSQLSQRRRKGSQLSTERVDVDGRCLQPLTCLVDCLRHPPELRGTTTDEQDAGRHGRQPKGIVGLETNQTQLFVIAIAPRRS